MAGNDSINRRADIGVPHKAKEAEEQDLDHVGGGLYWLTANLYGADHRHEELD